KDAPVAAIPSPAVEEVKRALDDLEQWLDDSSDEKGWVRYLKLTELHRQLSARAADPLVVRRIHARFSSEADGLDARRFVAVRQALDTWLTDLPVPPDALPDF